MVRNTTEVQIAGVLAERWSPWGFDSSHRLSEMELRSIFEAARWAPSARNTQPWKFVAAHRGTEQFSLIYEALADLNQVWAGAASVLIAAFAEATRNGEPQRWAEYDLGQAMAHLTIQAEWLGLRVHQMGGFDPEALNASFAPGPAFVPVVVAAVGRHSEQVDEAIRARDAGTRERKPYEDLFL